MNFLSIDPGGTTGFAHFLQEEDEQWRVKTFGEVAKADVYDWIEDTGPDLYVVENYRVRPQSISGYSHQWSSGETLRIIGALESRARRIGSPLVLQEPAIKPVGYAHAGLKYVKDKKGMHVQDAIAHGVFYLVKQLKVNPKSLHLAGGK